MRCRAIKNGEIIWFGSAGLDYTQPVYDNTGALVGYNSLKADSFSDAQQGVCDSLTQRLSVFRNELWYKMSYGLPLFEKVKSKTLMDSEVTNIIMSHPDVIEIQNFESNIVDKHYTFNCNVLSKYGQISVNSSEIQV